MERVYRWLMSLSYLNDGISSACAYYTNITQMKSFTFYVLFFVALLSLSCQKSTPQGPSKNETIDKYDNYTSWAIYRGDKKSNQYSELAQINAANVSKLKPVWEYHTGDPNGPSMYSNAIIVEGLMYFTTPRLDAIALNAVTGEQVWKFESAQYNEDKKIFRGRSRGVTYWEGA